MRHATVSVVIPCYNQGRFLGEAIDSVLTQSVPAAEVIVVDDGSDDDTAAVTARYSSVAYVRQRNLGLAQARNRGLREAGGDYLVFLDSDDRLHPMALEVGVRELAAHPAAAFAFGRCLRIDVHGHPLPTVWPPLVGPDAYHVLLGRNVIWTPAVAVFRRALCGRDLWFDASVDAAADYDLYLRLTRHLPTRSHEHLVADYRLHDGGMSRDAALMLRSTLKVLNAHRRAAPPTHAPRFRAAARRWTRFYGEQLIEQLGGRRRGRASWRAVGRDLGVLLRHYPQGAARHLVRKVARTRASQRPSPARAGDVTATGDDWERGLARCELKSGAAANE
jgi:glycosyltransferase involved in cell wall biosynthesis